LAAGVYIWRRAAARTFDDAVSVDYGFCGFVVAAQHAGYQVKAGRLRGALGCTKIGYSMTQYVVMLR
jgi:hypothetical protein